MRPLGYEPDDSRLRRVDGSPDGPLTSSGWALTSWRGAARPAAELAGRLHCQRAIWQLPRPRLRCLNASVHIAGIRVSDPAGRFSA